MRTSTQISSFFVCLIALILGATARPAHAQERYAVVIGIDSYAESTGFGKLKSCVKDSLEMNDTLKKCGYEHILLLNDLGGLTREQADQLNAAERFNQRGNLPIAETLRKRIPEALANAQPDDMVLVYFSGHGVLHEGQGILATLDCERDDPLNTGLPTAELQDMLLACKAKKKVLMLDCCHAGAAAVDKSGATTTSPEELATVFQLAQGLVTLASCGPNQVSLQDPESGLSYFTLYLTKGLRGHADVDFNGFVDHQELYNYVSKHVQAAVSFGTGVLKQSPKLIANNAEGVFLVANAVEKLPRPDPTPEADPSTLPPPPGQEAEDAYRRLLVGSNQPGADIQFLVAEAEKLRESLQIADTKSAVARPSTGNPFYNKSRANTAFQWLSAASKTCEMSDIQLDAANDISLKTSHALAAWFKFKRDGEVAKRLVDELYPFDGSPEIETLKPQLLLVHAETRDTNSAAGQQAALESYARILQIAQDYENQTGDAMEPHPLMRDVINPAREFSARLQQTSDPTTRQKLAAVHGMYGELVARYSQHFLDLREQAKADLELAMALDSQSGSHPINLALVLMQMPSADYTRVRELTQQSLRLSNDKLNQMISHRINGQAWLQGLTELTDIAQKRQHAENAIESLSRSVSLYEREFQNGTLQPRAAEQYVDSLVLRADAFKDRANFLLDFQGNGRRDALDKAIADARKAAEINDDRLQYRAWIALGNALEDSAWIGKQSEDYLEASEVFKTALRIYDDPTNVQNRIHLARCMIKWEIDGGQEGHLADAKAELEYLIEYANLDPTGQAKAHYWMSKIHTHTGNFAEADKSLELAWKGMKDNPRITKYDFSVCVADRVKLSLRAAELAPRGTNVDPNETSAETYLANAVYYARELESYDASKAVVLQGVGLAKQAELFKSQGDTEKSRKKLDEAMAIYSKQLGRSDLEDRQRSALLLGRCDLIITSELQSEDFAKETPQSLTDAIEAAKLAKLTGAEGDYAAAKGWSGFVLVEISQPPRRRLEDLDTNPLYSTAINDLEEALKLAPKHDSAPRWRYSVGYAMYLKSLVLKAHPTRQPTRELIQKADQYLKLAAEGDPTFAGRVKIFRERLQRLGAG